MIHCFLCIIVASIELFYKNHLLIFVVVICCIPEIKLSDMLLKYPSSTVPAESIGFVANVKAVKAPLEATKRFFEIKLNTKFLK